jgi:hypothetical protein
MRVSHASAFVVAWTQSAITFRLCWLTDQTRRTEERELAQAIRILAEVTVLQPGPDYLVSRVACMSATDGRLLIGAVRFGSLKPSPYVPQEWHLDH